MKDFFAGKRLALALEWVPFGSAILVYIACLFVVGINGDFPLNDDYVYGLSVKHFLTTGEWQLFSSASACFLHVLIGAAVCWLTGFSFEALRCISLVFGFVGLICIYLILRELEVSRPVAGLAANLYAVNPILVNLEFTYMTDVPALALTAASQLFFLKGIKTQSRFMFLIAGLLLTGASLIRPTALPFAVLNLAFAFVLFLKRRRLSIVVAFAALAPMAAIAAASAAVEKSTMMPEVYGFHKSTLITLAGSLGAQPQVFSRALLVRLGETAAYLGLFAAPILLFCLNSACVKQIRTELRYLHIVPIVACACLLYGIIAVDQVMPFYRNIWFITSLGARGLLGHAAPVPTIVSVPFTLLAIVGCCCFLYVTTFGALQALRSLRQALSTRQSNRHEEVEPDRQILCFGYCILAFLAAGAFCVVHLAVGRFDRYLLEAMVPSIVCIALSITWLNTRPRWLLSAGLLAMMGIYSISAQHSYMSWNRVRWQAIGDLERAGIARERIDGGAEFAFLSDITLWKCFRFEGFRQMVPIQFRGSSPGNELRWWPVRGDDYVVSLVEIPGYRQLRSYSFQSGFPWKYDRILVLERSTARDSGTAETGGPQRPGTRISETTRKLY